MNERNDIPQVALFIDVDNFSLSAEQFGYDFDIANILVIAKEYGQVTVAKAYADWTILPANNHIFTMKNLAIEMVMLVMDRKEKNTADIQIAVDALELTLLPNAPDTIVLVSGDRDFVPVAQRIKRYGKAVIGIGFKESTNRALEAICTKFVYYEDFVSCKSKKGDGEQKNSLPEYFPPIDRNLEKIDDPYRLFAQAVASLKHGKEELSSERLLSMMTKIDPKFDYTNLGFESFQGFVESAELRNQSNLHHWENNCFGMPQQELIISADHSSQDLLDEQSHFVENETFHRYRMVLDENNIYLIPWKERRLLINKLCPYMRYKAVEMEKWEIERFLENLAEESKLKIPYISLKRLVVAMFIAGVLVPVKGSDGLKGFFEDANIKLRIRAKPSIAYLRIHFVYLKYLKMAYPKDPLEIDAVSLLLYNSMDDDALARTELDIEYFNNIFQCPSNNEIEGSNTGLSQRALFTGFLDRFFKTGNYETMESLVSQYKKIVRETYGYLQCTLDANTIMLRCVEENIFSQVKDGEVEIYILKPDWKKRLCDSHDTIFSEVC